MKHLSVAIIVVFLLLGDFGAVWLHFPGREQQGWSVADSFSLIFAGAWFFHHRDRITK